MTIELLDPILSEGDPDPILRHGLERTAPFLFVCDHAGNAVPKSLGTLGLSMAELNDHIAWDPNAWNITVEVADLLGAAALGQAYSRLVIDSNRKVTAQDSVASSSDGVVVPGNAACTPHEHRRRHAEIMEPYQSAVADRLAHMKRNGGACIVSMHSFTRRLSGGAPRPWHVGVISGPDARMREPVFAALAAAPGGLIVGENVPYTVSMEKDFTIPVHAESQAVPYVEFEFRNDSFGTPAARGELARLVADALRLAYAGLAR